MQNISAVILTKNEEKNIVDCIETLRWCNEIIVIDDESSDRTVEIARKNRATVFIRSLGNNFSDQRNFGISKSEGPWIFFVDADERVTKELRDEIIEQIAESNSSDHGFRIRRVDNMWGQRLNHGETGSVTLLRIGKKGYGEWKRSIHEIWNLKGKITKLNSNLTHFPHQSITEFLKEINFYTDLRATELNSNGKKVKVWEIAFYPFAKFIYNYFIKLGFLDGIPGLIVTIIMSMHSFMVRGKLWQIQTLRKENI